MTPHRPFGIGILAILAGAAAVIAGIHTLQHLHLLPFFLGPLTFFGFDLLGALVWGVSTFIWLWVAMQLWTVNPQGWMFCVVLAVLNLVLAFVSVLGQSTFSAIVPAVLVNGIVLLYCLMPGVKRAFDEQAAPARVA